MDIQSDVRKWLFENADDGYSKFQSKLLPGIAPGRIIGVRTPLLKAKARELKKSHAELEYLEICGHDYFEENQLCAFIISAMKDFDGCMARLESFFPYMDNWATCDQTLPVSFASNKDRLLPAVDRWLESGDTYKVRFAIGMLMKHYLGSDFETCHSDRVASVSCDEFYVKMEIAWYFATALCYHWDEVIIYLEQERLEKWTHNKTIQKAVESRRITGDRKEYLRTLRRRGK